MTNPDLTDYIDFLSDPASFPEPTGGVYEFMLMQTQHEIQKNGAVVLDATYQHEAQLARLADYCSSNGYCLLAIHTTAPANVVTQWLKKRETGPSVSDMRLSDYHTDTFEPGFEIRHVL